VSEAAAGAAWTGPIPRPTRHSRPFWEAAAEHRLVIQRSKKTGRYVFYPRAVSPFGADDILEWVEVSGLGTVHAFSIARTATAAHLADRVPYVIAVVELEEGPHMTANIVGCDPESVTIGMAVEAAYEDIAPGVSLVQFRPAR
jgi:uncharacterized OB-fold protein